MSAHLVIVVAGNTDMALSFSLVLVDIARAGCLAVHARFRHLPASVSCPPLTLVPAGYWIQIIQMLPVPTLRPSITKQ